MTGKLYTIGHSTRTIEEFISILKEHDIGLVVDLRTHPFSRWMPQFNREKLKASLGDERIEYLYFGDRLGGRPEGGLEAFLASDIFRKNVTSLLIQIEGTNAALMCAERDLEKCHRRFIVEEIVKRGSEVKELGGKNAPKAGTLDDWPNR